MLRSLVGSEMCIRDRTNYTIARTSETSYFLGVEFALLHVADCAHPLRSFSSIEPQTPIDSRCMRAAAHVRGCHPFRQRNLGTVYQVPCTPLWIRNRWQPSSHHPSH
eukprot:TRINITY_DN23176_c0_g1_i2.p1 TRINITY_DN23176_c0_g1~~TRINITY_DN23176_c0_g1_i2.p1  ORF type:complete len:107 (+),score=6.50 TRINITY_DN23176_c0_g1_i2:119-439(+)